MLQMLLDGEYLRFGNDDRPSNDRATPGTSPLRNGASGHGESIHKAQTSDNFGPLPNRDGGGRVDVVLVSIREALRCWWSPQIAPFFLIVRAQSVWVKNILIDFFITDIQLFTWQDIHWWTGVMWLTLMWLSIRTLLLMAPIHCRGSIGEQVV